MALTRITQKYGIPATLDGCVGYKIFDAKRNYNGSYELTPQYQSRIVLKSGQNEKLVYSYPTNRWLWDASNATLKSCDYHLPYATGFHIFRYLTGARQNIDLLHREYRTRYTPFNGWTHDKLVVLPVLFDKVVAEGVQFDCAIIVAKEMYIVDDYNEF